MNYKRIATAFLVAVLSVFLLGASAISDNLFANPQFEKDETGSVADWKAFGGATVTYTSEDGAAIASIQLTEAGYAGIRQTIQVEPEAIYCITFTARVKEHTGKGAYAEIVGLSGAQSAQALSEEWTTYEMYGMTSPEDPNLTIAFSFGDASRKALGTAEFKDIEIVQVDDVPSDALYVWFYDREAWEDANNTTGSEDADEMAGDWQSGVVALAFLVLVWLLARENVFAKRTLPDDAKSLYEGKIRIWLYMAIGFTISCVCALIWFGHSYDMSCFTGWSRQLAEVGIPNFYTSGIWADYPPGYFYPLYIVGLLGKWFHLFGTPLFNLLVKLPAILADAGCAYMVYRIAKPHLGARSAANLGGLMALCPMVILNSGIWGQVDSVLTLVAFATLWFCMQNKKELCALLFAIGLLIKPQMLFFGPVLLVAFLRDLTGKHWKKELLHTGLAVLVGVATVVVLALPFSLNQEPTWLIDLYTKTTGQYPYASVNAFNLYAMLGKNWAADSSTFLFGLSAKTFGTICIVLSCLLGAAIYLKSRDRKAIFPATAVTLWGIFALGHNMHERYLFPVMVLLILSYALYHDKRFLISFAIAAGTMFVNCMVVLLNEFPVTNLVVVATSAINVLGFVFTVLICFNKRFGKAFLEKTAQQPKPSAKMWRRTTALFLPQRSRTGERMVRRDYIFMLLITLVYAAVALVNLGSTQVPENSWRPMEKQEIVLVDLGREQDISYLYYYTSVGSGNVRVEYSVDGENYENSFILKTTEGEMYTWQRVDMFDELYTPTVKARYVKLTNLKAGVNILELGIYAEEGVRITPVSVTSLSESPTGNAQALFDEQDLIDESPSYMTEMYFDEVYHARTAYEHLHGMAPYENTHPPLGKIFIMLGIVLFGMNPFGWRIVGTLFGVGMLPLIYVFAKRLFKDTRYAVIACLLFALDGMHFAQTRIATIDVYGVFFIIAMCYFMYRYWTMNFFRDKLSKTFVPLGLCGIMFGLGAASKWIGFYAGVGLAIAFFWTLVKRYREYLHARARMEIAEGEEAALCRHIVETFWGNTVKTLLFCVVFFLIIPAGIYLASYLPYLLCTEHPYDLQGVWDIQKYMFNYHSGLTATHSFQSAWYAWPLIIRPIFYFQGQHVAEGMMSSIASFGNPAVWWTGFVAVIYIIIYMCSKRNKGLKLVDRSDATYLFICLGAAFLPWVLITRCTFIYHYFASVPFIILFTVMMLKRFERPSGKLCAGAWILCIVAAGLFILFYPVWSGWEINRAFALNWLRWFDSWWFF